MKNMRILFLGDASSVHIQKWAAYFSSNGYEIGIISLHNAVVPNVTVYSIDNSNSYNINDVSKLKYIFKISRIREIINKFKPDILHAHYASSYGLLGALSEFHPYIISVWGSDIFEFPRKSYLHKKLIEFNLKAADYICSTSDIMAKETQKYYNKEVLVTPFGVECDMFKPMPEYRSNDKIIVGTVKSLEKIYGVEYLIKAFSILTEKYPKAPIELHIAGKGSEENHLKELSHSLNMAHRIKFLGFVPHEEVFKVLNSFSVAVFASNFESFGVATIESSACGIPVVVSKVGGLLEIAVNGVTGFVVPPRDPEAIAEAIEKIIFNKQLMEKMSENGRRYVLEKYEWTETSKIMENLYIKIHDTYGK